MKNLVMFLLSVALLSLSACSLKAKVLNADNTGVTPLDSSVPVAFVLAKNVPVVPESGIYRGTFETTSNDACTIDRMIDVTIEKARNVGANLIFAKQIKDVYVPGTTTYVSGVVVTTAGKNCVTILADFYYAETPAQAKLQQDNQNAFGQDKENVWEK